MKGKVLTAVVTAAGVAAVVTGVVTATGALATDGSGALATDGSGALATDGSDGIVAATADGFAAQAGGTTGGTGGTSVTVTSGDALKTAAKASGRAIIRISGTIALSGQIDVASDKTVLGVGADSGLTGGGLRIKNANNVIIQNLRISKAVGTDAITVQHSTHVWIDHNDLSSDQSHDKDYYDGLLDVTHASDYVTVSWNRLHDHHKGSLVGHSDDNAGEDTGHLRVTYHHNHFLHVNSRMPSLRFGRGHVYDNYFVDGSTAVHSRMGAQLLVQNNVFSQVDTPIQTNVSSDEDGYVNESGNDFGGGTNKISKTGTFTDPGYAYTLTPTASVVETVTTGAGTGKLS